MYKETIRRVESWLNLSSYEFQVVLFVFILFMGAAMLFVWANVKAVRQAYAYQTLKTEGHRLEKKYRLLALERDSLRSLYRVQDLAHNRIGMQFSSPGQVVTVFLQ